MNEVVEPFADGGCVIYGPFEFGLSQVFEQINAAHHLPELLKGSVQFILAGSAGQYSKNK